MAPMREAAGHVVFAVGAGVATFASWLAMGAGGPWRRARELGGLA
jgi:hypothetical protein